MPDSSLNYALIMERFIKQRTKTQEKAAAFLAISVGEVQEILQTGRVSVKVNKALTRMAPNLDLSEHESEVPEDANAEAENVPVSAPEVAPSVAPRAMTPEDLIASSYTPEVAREVAPKAMTPEDLIASSYTPEVTTPVERKAPRRLPEVTKPEARNVSADIPLSVTPSNEVVAEERDTTSAMSDATEVEKSRPIDLKKLDREGAQFIKVTERISAAEASLDDEDKKPDDAQPFGVVNNASLADELGLEELPEHVQSRARLEGEVLEVTPPVHEQDDAEMTVTVLEDTLPIRVPNDASLAGEVLEVTPPVHEQDDAEMTVTVLDDTLPVHVKDSASLVDEILEDVTSDREADEVSPQDEMVKETPVSRAPSVVNKPTRQQEIVDEVAVELGVVPREELEAHRELEAITEEVSSTPAGPQMSIHDGVDLVITMTEEEASEWLTDGDGVTQHDASGLSEETQMWELMEADRAAEETAEPKAEEPAPREDTELDDEFKRLVDAEAMGEYVTAWLRRHARWSAFQQKHNSLVKSYPATGEDTQSPAKHSEAADTTDQALANRDNMSLVGSATERRKIIQQGHIDPAIVSIESCPGEEEFYGTNAMAAVDEWRSLHRQSMGMQSKWNFDNESSEYLLCRDKILAVEVYLIGEHALTIKRPQAPETPSIWDEFKRNEEVAVRLNDRTSLIPRYKEAREDEQKQAAMELLKNIALVPVRAPGWGWKWVSKKVTDKRQSAMSGAQNRNNQI